MDTDIPLKGDQQRADEVMEALVGWADTWSPGFRDHVRGVSDGEIEALEQLSPQLFPAIYYAFLRKLGHSAWNLEFPAYDLSYEAVYNLRRRHIAAPALPARYVLVGEDTSHNERDVYIEARDPSCFDGPICLIFRPDEDPEEPRDPNEEERRFYVSFQDFIFRSTLESLWMERLPHRAFFFADDCPENRQIGYNLSQSSGLTPIPFVTPEGPCFSSAEGAIHFYTPPQSGTSLISLRGTDERMVKRWAAILDDQGGRFRRDTEDEEDWTIRL